MPFYHGTHRWHLPIIQKYGLGGLLAQKNFEGADNGVYLSEEPAYRIVLLSLPNII